jgi:hypothetical protein
VNAVKDPDAVGKTYQAVGYVHNFPFIRNWVKVSFLVFPQ